MERMLVVVFDNEKKAYEGQSALRQLDLQGEITVFAGAVILKHADGTVSVKKVDEGEPLGTLTGTAVGSLVGLLGGPVGMAVGAASGLGFGALYDLDNVGVGSDFLEEVGASLTPNRVAVVAEVEEGWTTPVDTRMEALGGVVFRRAVWDVREDFRKQDIAAMNADLAELKAEMSKANAERKAKLQARVQHLEARIAEQQRKAKEHKNAFEARQKAKAEVLKKNARAAGRAIKELANTPV
jgi:uncharacterized membrane protein